LVLSRRRESSTLARRWSGLLFSVFGLLLWMPNPNLVAMTTWSRTGVKALPTSSDDVDTVLLGDVEAVGVA
jgi:hypothetical protein